MIPDGIASVPPGDVRQPEETGVPVMSRVHTATLTGAVEIARRVEMIMPLTTAVVVATTEVVEAGIPVELVDMMSGVSACLVAALSRRYGRLQGVAQPMSVIAPDPVAV
jgi:hypothetical protein